MTGIESENFYAQDIKSYEIRNNKEFLEWLNAKKKEGYQEIMSSDELQSLINYITTWYEIKYPERELEKLEGVTYFNFEGLKPLSNEMDIRKLFYRLSIDENCLLECDYRARGWGQHPIYENGKVSKWITHMFLTINTKNQDAKLWSDPSFYLIYADDKTGKIENKDDLKKYVDKDSMTLEELLEELESKHSEELEFNELRETVSLHKTDVELRNKILELVSLKLLYSEHTIPERGYIRAKKFISEMNRELGTNLTVSQIEEIMKRDYKKSEEQHTPKGAMNLLKQIKYYNKQQ